MKRARIRGFLAFLRKQGCCCGCGRPAPSEAAHVRFSDAAAGRINPGISQKPDDRDAVPLNAWCHRLAADSQHSGSEAEFWRRRGVDPRLIAVAMYASYVASIGGERNVVFDARKPKRRKKVEYRREEVAQQKPKRSWPKRAFPRGRGFDKGGAGWLDR